LLGRFISFDGGLPFLIDLREELLEHRRSSPALEALDHDLRDMLERWFDVGLLRLERLTWNTSAALLEKLIDYEAVHAIESWDDLRGRLGPGRRCYAFLHPAIPDDPLIFVEVALERGIPGSVRDILDHQAERFDGSDADTAVFYSISNCHEGLVGVSLGDFLIKRVVQQLASELPDLKHFVTLSPLPGFRRWALAQPDCPDIPDTPTDGLDSRSFLGFAARYLTTEKRTGRALDPVAHFHLSNGARVEQLHWWANPTSAGWDRGVGMMVNYYYELNSIEENRDRYVQEGRIATSDSIRKLAANG
jgi:malonyl-CoA decarboxylase